MFNFLKKKVYHCDKCDKEIDKSDYSVFDGYCDECFEEEWDIIHEQKTENTFTNKQRIALLIAKEQFGEKFDFKNDPEVKNLNFSPSQLKSMLEKALNYR